MKTITIHHVTLPEHDPVTNALIGQAASHLIDLNFDGSPNWSAEFEHSGIKWIVSYRPPLTPIDEEEIQFFHLQPSR